MKTCSICGKEIKKKVCGVCELCYKKQHYKQNKEKIYEARKAYQHQYYQENKQKKKEQTRTNQKKRRDSDVCFRIATNLRNRFRAALVGIGYKRGSAVRDIGCSFEELRTHLESLFQPGMSWENYGEWEIDHMKPVSSFDLREEEQQRTVNHYTNLQPLWKTENRSKSGKWEDDTIDSVEGV
jgi:hypothetical protein